MCRMLGGPYSKSLITLFYQMTLGTMCIIFSAWHSNINGNDSGHFFSDRDDQNHNRDSQALKIIQIVPKKLR